MVGDTFFSNEQNRAKDRGLAVATKSTTQHLEEIFPHLLELKDLNEAGKKTFEMARKYLRELYTELDRLGVSYNKRFDL